MKVDASGTVAELKQRIQDTIGVPVEYQELDFSGRLLSDEAVLCASLIRQGSVVHIRHSELLPSVPHGDSERSSGSAPVPAESERLSTAFGSMLRSRRSWNRLLRMTPGFSGGQLLADGDRLALQHRWGLLRSGKAAPGSISVIALQEACRCNLYGMVRLLVQHYGVRVDAADGMGHWTALHAAVARAQTPMVHLLLRLGATDRPAMDGVQASALVWQARHTPKREPEGVADKGDDDWESDTATDARLTAWGSLFWDTEKDQWNVPDLVTTTVWRLVMMCADATIATEQLCRYLSRAASVHGARVVTKGVWDFVSKKFVVGSAAQHRRVSLLRQCLEMGADPNGDALRLLCATADVTPAFADASSPGALVTARRLRKECLRVLVSFGADVNRLTVFGKTPLSVACEAGQVDCVRYLIQLGADLNVSDSVGRTPLAVACLHGAFQCARLLLTAGARDSVPEASVTPIWVAAALGDANRLESLLALSGQSQELDELRGETTAGKETEQETEEAELEKEETDETNVVTDTDRPEGNRIRGGGASSVSSGESDGAACVVGGALHIACAVGNTECVRLLCQAGASVDELGPVHLSLRPAVVGPRGRLPRLWRPLHAACRYGHAECAWRLLDYGADVDGEDDVGNTALHYASMHWHRECVLVLFQQGAAIPPLTEMLASTSSSDANTNAEETDREGDTLQPPAPDVVVGVDREIVAAVALARRDRPGAVARLQRIVQRDQGAATCALQ